MNLAFARSRVVFVAFAALSLARAAHAQCPEWKSGFGLPGSEGAVFAVRSADLGSGPSVYIGGTFGTAGSVLAANIARWDGSDFAPLGSGTNGVVTELVSYDSGSGPALYAAGTFTNAGGVGALRIARWNGSAWSSVDGGVGSPQAGTVNALLVHDDGGGARLYAAGMFQQAGSVFLSNITRWNGSAWSAVGTGISGSVAALASFDDGSGPRLFASVSTTSARVQVWDGTAWAPAETGLSAAPNAFVVFDDGTGPALYASVLATGASGHALARWNGTSWVSASAPAPGAIYALLVHDDGSGPAIVALGGVSNPLPFGYAARWNGSAWVQLGTPLHGVLGTVGAPVYAGDVLDDGTGEELVVGGEFFTTAVRAVPRIARVRAGGDWLPLTTDRGVLAWSNPAATIHCLAAFDAGSGAELYAGGRFLSPASPALEGIARFDGTTWRRLGSGIDGIVYTSAVHDDGAGDQLYVGGVFGVAGGVAVSNLARWDGASWSALPGGAPGPAIYALLAHDDGSGSALYATDDDVQRWNGSTWTALPSLPGARLLALHDDGAGVRLYASHGALHDRVSAWDGVAWTNVGQIVGPVHALLSFDDGSGPGLYAAGTDGVWRRSSPLGFLSFAPMPGGGSFSSVDALAVHDDGSGPELYAGGAFLGAGGTTLTRMARWNGSSWEALGSGIGKPVNGTDGVRALLSFDDHSGGGADLFAAGNFDRAGGRAAHGIVAWRRCDDPGSTFCAGDGSGTPCPCGNVGASGRGCANSVDLRGARLVASGVASISADSLVLSASSMPNASALFVQASARANGGFGVASFDGLRCVGGAIVRLGAKLNGAGSSQYPAAGDTPVSVRGAIGPAGGTRHYQVLYRNSVPFCTSGTANWTNGVSVPWSP